MATVNGKPYDFDAILASSKNLPPWFYEEMDDLIDYAKEHTTKEGKTPNGLVIYYDEIEGKKCIVVVPKYMTELGKKRALRDLQSMDRATFWLLSNEDD